MANPAVRSKIPILVRVVRTEKGYTEFRWYLRRPRWNRREERKEWYWKPWRCYVAHPGMSWREALDQYRDYAHYWRTGDFSLHSAAECLPWS